MTTDTVVSHSCSNNGSSSSKSSVPSSSSTSTSSTSSTPWFFYYIILLILLPFLLGCSFSMGMIHFPTNSSIISTTVSTPIRRLFSSIFPNIISSNSNNRHDIHLSSSPVLVVRPIMDLDRCFQQFERRMLESNHDLQQQWDEFNGISIFLHRNGQAESCGNFSSSSNSSRSVDRSSDSESDSTNTTDPTLSSSSLSVKIIFRTALQELYHLGQACPDFTNKYHVESFLTRVFVHLLSHASSQVAVCHSEDDDIHKHRNTRHFGLYDYCDMGEEMTPILLDHNKLIPNTIIQSSSTNDGTMSPHRTYTFLPCHFHTENGLRVTSLLQLTGLLRQSKTNTITTTTTGTTAESTETEPNNCLITPEGEETCPTITSNVPTTNTLAQQQQQLGLHLYAVPAGRVFMHVAAYIGQEIPLDHVPGADPNERVYLKVLSVSPAVFDLYNFFTKDESNELVQRALSETKESHRIKRSTTGTGEHHVNTRRTSESGFDTDGATSILIKKYVYFI